jgi:hypothetical protein
MLINVIKELYFHSKPDRLLVANPIVFTEQQPSRMQALIFVTKKIVIAVTETDALDAINQRVKFYEPDGTEFQSETVDFVKKNGWTIEIVTQDELDTRSSRL